METVDHEALVLPILKERARPLMSNMLSSNINESLFFPTYQSANDYLSSYMGILDPFMHHPRPWPSHIQWINVKEKMAILTSILPNEVDWFEGELADRLDGWFAFLLCLPLGNADLTKL